MSATESTYQTRAVDLMIRSIGAEEQSKTDQ
jgi:hypothetical protein